MWWLVALVLVAHGCAEECRPPCERAAANYGDPVLPCGIGCSIGGSDKSGSCSYLCGKSYTDVYEVQACIIGCTLQRAEIDPEPTEPTPDPEPTPEPEPEPVIAKDVLSPSSTDAGARTLAVVAIVMAALSLLGVIVVVLITRHKQPRPATPNIAYTFDSSTPEPEWHPAEPQYEQPFAHKYDSVNQPQPDQPPPEQHPSAYDSAGGPLSDPTYDAAEPTAIYSHADA